MGRIAEETIARVAAANDVVEVIGSYLQLKRAGSSWRALCPFHNEKSPSFHVNPARQSFHCFGCGAGGSVFRFVMDYEHVDFPGAVRKLAARAGIPILDETPEDIARRGERDRLLALHRDVAGWFHANLMKRPFAAQAREYLKGRGLGQEVAVRWQLGYAPDSWDALAGWAVGRGYGESELARAGLVATREGGGIYDRFRHRVMFPIHSDYGEVIAFSGRTLGDDPAKYVNSPETPIFTKGRVLFGLDKTKRAIIEANEAVVCEGQIDLISAFEAGVTNVIAPQGTAFTTQQARLVRQFAETVVLCFDSDLAGQKAVERSLPSLLAKGLTVRVARMPAGEDPDSLIRKGGAAALVERLKAAKDYFEDALDRGMAGDPSPQRRAALARQMADFVAAVEDPALREALGNRIRSRLELSAEAFGALLRTADRPRVAEDDGGDRGDGESSGAGPTPEITLPERARLLCRVALVSPEARAWLRSQASRAEDFGSEYALVDRIVGSDAPLEDPGAFVAFCSGLPPAEERALTGLSFDHLPKDPVLAAREAWSGLAARELEAQMARLQAKMRAPGRSMDEITLIHKQILDLQGRLSEIRQPFLT